MVNPNQIVNRILGDRKSKNAENAIPGKKCYNCGKTFQAGDKWYYYYHGDQDDRVCVNCAKNLKQGDTAYRGLSVFKTGG